MSISFRCISFSIRALQPLGEGLLEGNQGGCEVLKIVLQAHAQEISVPHCLRSLILQGQVVPVNP